MNSHCFKVESHRILVLLSLKLCFFFISGNSKFSLKGELFFGAESVTSAMKLGCIANDLYMYLDFFFSFLVFRIFFVCYNCTWLLSRIFPLQCNTTNLPCPCPSPSPFPSPVFKFPDSEVLSSRELLCKVKSYTY